MATARKREPGVPGLRLHDPGPEPRTTSRPRWAVNGWELLVECWTAQEWAALADRPADAREFPNGVWAAVRMG